MSDSLALSKFLPLFAILFILSSILLFGPLSPVYSHGPARADSGIGVGSANATVLKPPPESLTLEAGQYNSGQFVLRVPSAMVSVDSVTGQPLLTYKAQLTELGYAQSTIAELSPESEGEVTLSPKPITIDAERVQNDTYAAELSIVLRASGKQTLYRENVTVNVER